METGYKVYEVMNRDVQTAECETTICDIANQMKTAKVGSIIILKENSPVGIITEQDVVRKVVAEKNNPKETIVEDIADENLISIESTRDLYDAMVLMGNSEIKHLPVIDEGELVGIITGKDIMRIEPHLIEMLSFKASLDKEEAKKLFKKL